MHARSSRTTVFNSLYIYRCCVGKPACPHIAAVVVPSSRILSCTGVTLPNEFYPNSENTNIQALNGILMHALTPMSNEHDCVVRSMAA